MFDIGWIELMIIGIVALIVIGPKDLPVMFRTLGKFTAKAKSMARDFQRAMNAAAEDTGVKDVAKDLKNITSPKSMGLDALKGAVDQFEGWDPLKAAKEATSVPEKLSPSEDAKKASAATRKLKKAKAKSSDALNFASVATARDKKLVTSTATATKAAPAKAYPLKAAAKTSPTPAFDKPTASKVTAGSKATPTLKKAIKSSQGDA